MLNEMHFVIKWVFVKGTDTGGSRGRLTGWAKGTIHHYPIKFWYKLSDFLRQATFVNPS